ncbi:major facilitator superfamily domain-containing protein [Mycena albidolilacea]|uniref:Major facilitator superfamily domain-containing protein n=1 Tax=Mycena albidolilacea TaxID=1033008 RepID=A0AAD7EX45_9AGAR|nr:major facilitator superfamily domain-containing protein [Mycena albidolilacea]
MHEQAEDDSVTRSQSHDEPVKPTPIPKFQLFIILLIQFAEPITALVIYPFVVQFVRETGITGGDETKTGFYAGMLASPLQFSPFPVFSDFQESSFFLAECLTMYQLGRVSDIYGRRPVLLFGPLGLGLAVLGFGLSTSFWMLLGFRCAQGAFNGNLGVAKTVMNEISDPSNVADILALVCLLFFARCSLILACSPFMGGVLANAAVKWPDTLGKIALLRAHPYFLPCAVAASVAFISFAFAFFGLRETLPSIVERDKRRRNEPLSETDPLLVVEDATPTPALADESESGVENVPPLRGLLTRDVYIAILNYRMLCLCDMAHDSLLPLMYSTPIALGGLGLEPFDIGLILGLCGVSNAIVQALLEGCVIRYFGARHISINGFCALALVFTIYPVLSLLARRAGCVDKWVVAGVVCQLSCSFAMYFSYGASMLFIMDSAPNLASVGSVTRLSQMAGTVFRSVAPSIAFSLFALSVKHNVAGGYLVYIGLVGLTGCALRCAMLLPRRMKSDWEADSGAEAEVVGES